MRVCLWYSRREKKMMTRYLTIVAVSLFAITSVSADVNIQGDEVNISGATLFKDFFKSPASTNDWIDVDNDGIWGFDPDTWLVDQLAPTFNCPNWSGWWLVQYRGIGSGNGLAELVDYHLLGEISEDVPTGVGLINRVIWAEDGDIVPTGCGMDWPSGTPYAPSRVDMAVLDVPVRWFVTQSGTPAWSLNPGAPGYGSCPTLSWDTGYKNTLKSLEREDPNDPNSTISMNINVESPDRGTIFDTQIAWVPISIISNRGADLENVKVSELRYLFLTGRMPSGENLLAATRDSGSGTRNGGMNSLGIDPSWARGDNLGSKNKNADRTRLGPNHQATNNGGSSIMEAAVQRRQLAVGYTGLMGGSRSAADARAGKYEITNIMFDDRGGSVYVRPSIDNILDNLDPDNAWQIGGPETFATRGNPAVTGDPNYPSDTWMDPPAGADYINNIVESILGFEDPNDPNGIDPESQYNMPGEFLATTFVLLGGVDALPDPADPTAFAANTDLNQALQDYIREFNELDVPAYGTRTGAGKVPNREPYPCWEWDYSDPNDPVCITPFEEQVYSDGSANGNYYNYFTDDPNDPHGGSIAGDSDLNVRNKISGDFNGDGARDFDDICAMMDAICDPGAYATNAMYNTTAGDPVVPEILGDFNGDGNFDALDVRYFADGLAIDPVTDVLRRKDAFVAVDDFWFTLMGEVNYFGTQLTGECKPYVPGDSRGDIAGNATTPGAAPLGADGIIDGTDIHYVYANFGDWSNIDDAVNMDLSADLTGDLIVDETDVAELVSVILGTAPGDLDWNCDVDLSDLAALLGNYGQTGELSYEDGDLDGNGTVDLSDLAALLGSYGFQGL